MFDCDIVLFNIYLSIAAFVLEHVIPHLIPVCVCVFLLYRHFALYHISGDTAKLQRHTKQSQDSKVCVCVCCFADIFQNVNI